MQIVDHESIFINSQNLREEKDLSGYFLDISNKYGDIHKYNFCAVTNWYVKKNEDLLIRPDVLNLRCDAASSDVEIENDNSYGDIIATININSDEFVFSKESTELLASMKKFSPKGRRIRFSISNSENEEIDLDKQCYFTFHLIKVDTTQYEKMNLMLEVFGTFIKSLRN